MSLPANLYATLKTYINAQNDLKNFPLGSDAAFAIAALLNAASSPAFIVTRSSVPTIALSTLPGIYVCLANMTTGNLTQWQVFLQMNPAPDSFVPNADIAAFFVNTFGGTLGGSGATTRAALVTVTQRTATRGEAVFATGTGTTASPGTLVYEGTLTYQDVQNARGG